MSPDPLVVAITGASGAPFALRLVQQLLLADREVHLSISPSGKMVLEQELGLLVSLDRFDPGQFWETPAHEPWWSRLGEALMEPDTHQPGVLRYHHFQDFMSPIASGSFLTAGMVICPCSGGTLSGVVHGASSNLIERAAEVHLKERRKLVLVTRETPLSIVHIRNLELAAAAGAVVLPAMPGWYHGVRTVFDLIDFIVARVLDQLGVPHQLMRRWGEEEPHA